MSSTAKQNNTCSTPDCGQASTLKCPVCLENGISTYFCSQHCFSSYYPIHRREHAGQKARLPVSFAYTGSLRPYEVTPIRTVPSTIKRPDYADHIAGFSKCEQNERPEDGIKVLNDEEIESAKVSSKLGREVLDEAMKIADVGVTTEYIDQIVHEACIERDCYPSPLNYYNFPKSCCTSVNEVICHGIPDMRPLQDGDILNVDVTVYHDGFHGDLNETIPIGNIDNESKKLIEAAYECLDLAIKAVKPGMRYRDIGSIIQPRARRDKFSVVRGYCGHGIHRLFHCNPSVPHYAKNKAVGIMKPGHLFTIEPMINAGSYHDDIWPDNWTAVTSDGCRSAQFEHTLLVTESGCDVLTKHFDDTPWFLKKISKQIT